MQEVERLQTSIAQASPHIDPTTTKIDAATNRAARLAQSTDSLIDRILSGDSRAFLDANRQTGGE